MSGHDDATPGVGAHTPQQHNDFDPEPAHSLPPDEKPSPGWLPIIGGVVLAALVAYFALGSDGAPAPGTSTSTPSATAPATPSVRAEREDAVRATPMPRAPNGPARTQPRGTAPPAAASGRVAP